MSSVKGELRALFESCNSYVEIFQMIGKAAQQGFKPEDINTAASWRKNRIAKDTQSSYKRIQVTVYNTQPTAKIASLPVEIRDLNSPRIVFDGKRFII